jgi:hypothetical protein
MENRDPNIELTYASSIENVDFAFYDWLDKELNLSCNSKDGFKKVPVIWVTPERAFQVKQNKEFRDVNGTLNVPLMTIERTSINKDVKNNATYYTNLPPKDNRQIIARRINQKKTSEFANADNNRKYGSIGFVSPKKNQKVVYQFDSMLLPVYANFTYNITIFTQFQQQMNELLQPFLARTGSTRYFLIERDGYKYECFIEPSFDTKNNIASMEEEERRYVTNITVKILANLVSEGANQVDSVIKTYENAVEIKLPRESLIVAKTQQVVPKEIVTPQGSNVGTQVYSNVLMKKVFVIGDGINSLYTVVHNFNTRDIITIVRENGDDYSRVEVAIDYSNPNHIHIDMGDIIDIDSYSVTVMG